MARARASKKSTTAAAATARNEPEEQPLQSTPADEKPAEEPAAKPAEDVEPASTVPGPPSPVLGQTSRPGSSLSYEVLARGSCTCLPKMDRRWLTGSWTTLSSMTRPGVTTRILP